MANIVINSRFNPYTYDEMLKPALMETQAHQDVENNLSDLATKSNVWEEMTNKETDPQAYNMYKNYSNDLQNKAAQLAAQGLNPNSRQNMLQMKQRYTKEIVPIEQAYTKRSQLADEQRKMQAQDNTTLFDRSAANMSLDELIKNPNITPVVQSGKDIEKRASDAFSHFAKDLKDDPTKYKHVMNGQYWEKVQRLGYRPEDIREAIMNDPNSSWALTEMRGQLLNTVPKEILANPANESKILNHINIGMASAIGTGDTKTAKDTDHDEFLKERLFRSRQRPPELDKTLPYRKVPHVTNTGEVKTTEIQNDANFLKQIQSNPNLLNETKTWGGVVGKPNLTKLKDLSKKYNIPLNIVSKDGKTDTGNLMLASKMLENEIKKSVVRDNDHILNATNGKTLANTILGNASVWAARNSKTTGLYDYSEGNKDKKQLTLDDVNKRLKGGDAELTFTPGEEGFKLNSRNGDNNFHSFLDPYLLDNSTRDYSRIIKVVNESMKKDPTQPIKVPGVYGDNGSDVFANSADLINHMISKLHTQFNTKEQTESDNAKQE